MAKTRRSFFVEQKLQIIQEAEQNNLKSQAIPVKLNFVKEGILRQAEFVNKQFLDLFLYSMISDEWQA